MEKELFNNIIKEICDDLNIGFKVLSHNWIIELKKENKIRHIFGYTFDINRHSSGLICKDKYSTYCVLKENNIPVVEHEILFNPYTKSYLASKDVNEHILKKYIEKYNKIIVKPNDGTQGMNVSLCNVYKEAKEKVEYIFSRYQDVVISPYYDIKSEYRTIYLDGKCCLTYDKVRNKIIGDGKRTVEELSKIQNADITKIEMEILSKVLEKDEELLIDFRHNLSHGAKVNIINNNSKINNMVKKVTKAINLKFGSVDIIEDFKGNVYLLEVNSGICMQKFISQVDNGYEIAKGIYKEAIENMF